MLNHCHISNKIKHPFAIGRFIVVPDHELNHIVHNFDARSVKDTGRAAGLKVNADQRFVTDRHDPPEPACRRLIEDGQKLFTASGPIE